MSIILAIKMKKSNISAVIVAHNEEKKIADCLESLDFVDEIVVVLDKCSDKTKEIVLKFGAKITEGSWNIEGERRNVGLNMAKNDWILELDADERISKELKEEILSLDKSKPCNYIIEFKNYLGKRHVKYGWLRVLGVDKKIILCYKGNKKFHEDKEIHPTADFKGEMRYLKNKMIHLADDDISDLIARFNRYTSWKANDLISKNKVKGGFFKFAIGIKMRFIKSFFIKKGYKEGFLGILIAILAAIYPLTSYIKAKEKLNENR